MAASQPGSLIGGIGGQHGIAPVTMEISIPFAAAKSLLYAHLAAIKSFASAPTTQTYCKEWPTTAIGRYSP
jgi:hypothetical protein